MRTRIGPPLGRGRPHGADRLAEESPRERGAGRQADDETGGGVAADRRVGLWSNQQPLCSPIALKPNRRRRRPLNSIDGNDAPNADASSRRRRSSGGGEPSPHVRSTRQQLK